MSFSGWSKYHQVQPLPGDDVPFNGNAIAVQQLQLRYPGEAKLALDIERWEVQRGVRTALLGVNGAGKSTLLKVLAGLLPLERGSIQVMGQPLGTYGNRLAYVSQIREVDWLFPVTVGEVALMGRDIHIHWPRRPSTKDRQCMLEALDKVGMGAFEQRPIAELSGGQRQRVFLARALAQEADLLLLDEPFSGVDATTETLMNEVFAELRAAGKTIVVATHDLARVEANFEVAVLLSCHIIAHGSPAKVLQSELLAQAYGGALAFCASSPRPVIKI